MSIEIADLLIRIQGDSKGAVQETQQAEDSLDRLGKKAEQILSQHDRMWSGLASGARVLTSPLTVATGAMSGLVGGVMHGLSVFGLAANGLNALKNATTGLVGGLLAGNAQMEDYTASFTTLLGSADKAKQRLSELSVLAAHTPMTLPEVADASRTLETLTKGALSTGAGLTLVGNVASATKQPFNDLAVIIGRVYSDISAGGRGMGQEIMRLTELGAISGDTKRKLQEMVDKGKTSPREMWELVAKDLQRFNGQMQIASSTFTGLSSTLSDNVGALRRSFAAPIFDLAKSGLKHLVDITGSPQAIQWATNLGHAVGDVLNKAISTMGQLWQQYGPVVLVILQRLWGHLQEFGQIVGSVWATVGPTLLQLALFFAEKVPSSLSVFRAAWTGFLQPAFTWFAGFVQQYVMPIAGQLINLFNQTLPTAVRIASQLFFSLLVPVFTTVAQVTQQFVIPAVAMIADWLGRVLPPVIQAFSSLWQNVLAPAVMFVGRVFRGILPVVLQIAQFLGGILVNQINMVVVVVKYLAQAWQSDWAGIRTVATVVGGIIYIVVRSIWDIISGLAQAIGGLLKPIGDAFAWLSGQAKTHGTDTGQKYVGSIEDEISKGIPGINSNLGVINSNLGSIQGGQLGGLIGGPYTAGIQDSIATGIPGINTNIGVVQGNLGSIPGGAIGHGIGGPWVAGINNAIGKELPGLAQTVQRVHDLLATMRQQEPIKVLSEQPFDIGDNARFYGPHTAPGSVGGTTQEINPAWRKWKSDYDQTIKYLQDSANNYNMQAASDAYRAAYDYAATFQPLPNSSALQTGVTSGVTSTAAMIGEMFANTRGGVPGGDSLSNKPLGTGGGGDGKGKKKGSGSGNVIDAVKAAQEHAQAIDEMVKAVIDAAERVSGYKLPSGYIAGIDEIGRGLEIGVEHLQGIALRFGAKGLNAVSAFSDASQKVFGALSTAFDFFTKLADSGARVLHGPDKLVNLANEISVKSVVIVNTLGGMIPAWSQLAAEKIGSFADASQKVFSGLSVAFDFFEKIEADGQRVLNGPVKLVNLANELSQKVVIVANTLGDMIPTWSEFAASKIGAFADASQKVFGALSVALDFFTKLVDSDSVLHGPMRLVTVANELSTKTVLVVDTLSAMIPQWNEFAANRVSQFADASQKVFAGLTSALNFFTALADSDKVLHGPMRLVSVANELSTKLVLVMDTLGAQIPLWDDFADRKVSAFADASAKVTDSLSKALSFLGELSKIDFRPELLADKVRSLVFAVADVMNRVGPVAGAWSDPKWLERVSSFADASGKVTASLQSAVTFFVALSGIKFDPAVLADRVTSLVYAVRHVMDTLGPLTVGWNDDKFLTPVTHFSTAAGTVSDNLGRGITFLDALFGSKTDYAGLAGRTTELANALRQMLDTLGPLTAGWTGDKYISSTTGFATAAGTVADNLGNGIGFLSSLFDAKRVPFKDLAGRVQELVSALRDTMDRVGSLTPQGFDVALVSGFADTAQKVMGALSAGVSFLQAIGSKDYAPPTIGGLSTFLDVFGQVVGEMGRKLNSYKGQIDDDTAKLAGYTSQILDAFSKALSIGKDLGDLTNQQDFSISTGVIDRIFAGLSYILDQVRLRAKDWLAQFGPDNPTGDIAGLATTVGTILDGVGKAIAPISSLSSYPQVSTVGINRFFASLDYFLTTFADRAKDWAARAVTQNAAIATSVGTVMEGVGKAIDPLTKILAFVVPDNLAGVSPEAKGALQIFFNGRAVGVGHGAGALTLGGTGHQSKYPGIDAFFAVLDDFLRVFALKSAEWKDRVTPAVTALATNIGLVMEGVSKALDPILKMGDAQKVQPGQIEGAMSNVWFALDQFDRVMTGGTQGQPFQGDWMARAQAFATELGTLFTMIGGSLDLLAAASSKQVNQDAIAGLFGSMGTAINDLLAGPIPALKAEFDPANAAGFTAIILTGWSHDDAHPNSVPKVFNTALHDMTHAAVDVYLPRMSSAFKQTMADIISYIDAAIAEMGRLQGYTGPGGGGGGGGGDNDGTGGGGNGAAIQRAGGEAAFDRGSRGLFSDRSTNAAMADAFAAGAATGGKISGGAGSTTVHNHYHITNPVYWEGAEIVDADLHRTSVKRRSLGARRTGLKAGNKLLRR